MSDSTLSTGAWLGMLGGALITLAFTLQKLWKSSVETRAGTSVVTLLHDELVRMAAQNAILAGELNKLQQEIVKLHSQLVELTRENSRLHTEVRALTEEVGRLQHILDKGQHLASEGGFS